MLALLMGGDCILAAPFLIHLPTDVTGKAAEDDPRVLRLLHPQKRLKDVLCPCLPCGSALAVAVI